MEIRHSLFDFMLSKAGAYLLPEVNDDVRWSGQSFFVTGS